MIAKMKRVWVLKSGVRERVSVGWVGGCLGRGELAQEQVQEQEGWRRNGVKEGRRWR